MVGGSVNIGGSDDAFFRYKMPQVVGKIEGKGNGIKTRVDNCYEVARALHRPPGYVCKFFGCELGALTKIDEEEGTYIVNGAFEDRVLAETLKKFIDMFVLCAKCKLPETDLKVKKNGDIRQICNACGNDGLCDMSHKLCTYILNNPPDGKKKAKDSKGSKAERRAKKAAASVAANSAASKSRDAEDEEARKARKAAKKAAKKAAEAEAAAAAAAGANGNGNTLDGAGNEDDGEDDVEWSVDMSEAAQEARARDMGGSAAALLERTSIVDDKELASKLRAYMDDGKKPRKVCDKAAKIYDGEEFVIRGILAATLLDETPASAVAAINQYALPNLAHFGSPLPGDLQKQVFDYFDFVTAKDPLALKMHPFVLKALYDGDAMEEDLILQWFKEGNGRQDVRESVRVIVDWLEEASEEEDGDEDEDDDE